MKRWAFLVVMGTLISTVAPAAAQTTLQGSWSITPSGQANRVRFELRTVDADGSKHSESSDTRSLSDLGLAQSQLDRTGSPLNFTFRREAGEIACTGTASRGSGFGHFLFTANPRYVQELRRRGYSLDSPRLLLPATLLDISTEYMDSIAAAGFTDVKFGNLIAFRALGIDASYIQSMRKQIAGVDSKTIVPLRALNVDNTYVNEMASVGYSHLTAGELIQMRALGIDAAFVRRAQAHGFKNLTVQKLVQAKAMGVL